MILERGPWAFYQGAKRFIRAYFVAASPGQELAAAACARITERVAVLSDLRERLATVTGQASCLNNYQIPSRFLGSNTGEECRNDGLN